MQKLLANFIAGGSVVVALSYATEIFGPKAGGIVFSYPLTFLVSLILLYIAENPTDTLVDFSHNAAILLVNTMIFLFTLKFTLPYFEKSGYKYYFLFALLVSTLIWLVFTLILDKLI